MSVRELMTRAFEVPTGERDEGFFEWFKFEIRELHESLDKKMIMEKLPRARVFVTIFKKR